MLSAGPFPPRLPLTEDRGADPHHRRALGDRRLEIVRHTHRQRIKRVAAGGAVLLFEREDDLDAVTAVSGSGPAYVFYFIEALARAARELGLSTEAAHQLSLGTFAGAVKLAAQASEPPETLRGRVTSKGGTIERALASMESDRVKDAIVRAAKAAAQRSHELGDELGKD